ncbi:hypothetical protein [Leptospira borgpetersenii]|uniref:hypothetical protein n=1 Tax=Leptospira borgpetersenii TaxID=174 RepID=UPI000349A235|nr:hypothetical protein [Leptospira borgpetersenii]URD71577.1 hypothetical protein LIX26_16510 [Leptospira borgpetersenii]UVD74779.1 hypothetical protein NU962_16675 [Leptospira borgpetersenii]UVD77964.1 hypothetical protein LIX27_16745 [Leptospira borgpetersenii]UZW34533.1 hypothetical protein OR565_16750 [Leptospira borgpetersenii]
MKPIDEIIENELSRFLEVVTNKFYLEMERGIQNASAGIAVFITEDNGPIRNTVSIYEFSQCSRCKTYHSNLEKHICKGSIPNA